MCVCEGGRGRGMCKCICIRGITVGSIPNYLSVCISVIISVALYV